MKSFRKIKQYRYYLSIDTLPLWNYIKIIDSGDIRYLIILDYYDVLPDVQVPQEYWNNILAEYFEASDSQKSKNYVSELSNILNRRKLFNTISDCCYILRCSIYLKKDYPPDIIKILEKSLREAGCDNYSYGNSLESIEEAERQSQGLKSLIENKMIAFDRKYGQNSSEKTDIYKVVEQLEIHRKLSIDLQKTTVRQFLAMQKLFVEQIRTRQHGRRA